MKEKLERYLKENLETTFIGHKNIMFNEEQCEESVCYRSSSANIKNYIEKNEQEPSFQKLLFKHIDNKNLKDSDVYNNVHIDRRLFSKIRNNNYHPSKETIILLGLSLKLTENEIEQLLESASYSLPKNNYFDLIIRFCFKERIYKLTEVNDLLKMYNCKEFYY